MASKGIGCRPDLTMQQAQARGGGVGARRVRWFKFKLISSPFWFAGIFCCAAFSCTGQCRAGYSLDCELWGHVEYVTLNADAIPAPSIAPTFSPMFHMCFACQATF